MMRYSRGVAGSVFVSKNRHVGCHTYWNPCLSAEEMYSATLAAPSNQDLQFRAPISHRTWDTCQVEINGNRGPSGRPNHGCRPGRWFAQRVMRTTLRSAATDKFVESRRCHCVASRRFTSCLGVCGTSSAKASQKPIISSLLGSPQRTAFVASGFSGLFTELSK